MMGKKSPVAIFMAATAILATTTITPDVANAKEKEKDLGGAKIWTTDQAADEEGELNESAKKAREKAKKTNVCIPVGEGENCW